MEILDRHGLTYKETVHAAEQQHENVHQVRQTWLDGQLDLDPDKLISIDETGATTKMARPRGCSRRASAAGRRTHGHWMTTTFTAGLHRNVPGAPMLLDGAMNGP